jgi:diketogulonate reductase-like aldo/keto reductase
LAPSTAEAKELRLIADDFIAIPGTKSTKYLKENWESRSVQVSKEEDKEIRDLIAQIPIGGTRYPEAMMHTVNI